jgi:hypothetical protein
MRKIFTLLSVMAVAAIALNAQNATFQWTLAGNGATSSDRSADVVTDGSGNIITANYFSNSVNFNGNTISGAPKGTGANYDVSLLVTKLTPLKATSWYLYNNVGTITPVAVAVATSGDVYLTATVRGIVGATSPTTANLIDASGSSVVTFTGLTTSAVQSFVAKFNSNGILQWIKELNSGTAKDKAITATALTTDASGNVYVAGTFTNTVIIPGSSNITLTTTNTTQAAFIAKLNGTDGNAVWGLASSGGIVSETLAGLTVADDGNLYAAGIYRNTSTPVSVSIGASSFTPSSGYDVTLIRLATDGTVSSIINRSNDKDTRVKDLLVKNGKAYVAGSFYSTGTGIKLADGVSKVITTSTYLNGFLLAFDAATGADLWQKTVASPGITDIDGIAICFDGRLYAFGAYGNKNGSATAAAVDFGNSQTIPDSSPTNAAADLFLASYNTSDGTTLELHKVATNAASYETANSLASSGNALYLLGSSNATGLTFENNSTFTTAGQYDFLLISYGDIPTGISTVKAGDKLFAYVDRTNKTIIVKEASEVTYARLVDISGRAVAETANSSDMLTLKAGGVAPGVYILKLTTTDGSVTAQKLLVP